MTPNHTKIKKGLLEAIRQLSLLFALPQQLRGITVNAFSEWKNVCEMISCQLTEELIRVAVVGAIKSGKSTFINSLLFGDYLKRGAGVVTSIVTRTRPGNALKATLFFKSWDQVNQDIAEALVLLPNFMLSQKDDRFDIRRSADRKALCGALETLGPEQLITHDSRNANSVLLNSYLKGYDQIHQLISADPVTQVYDADAFNTHRAFVGDDALAVYLTDIELEIKSDFMDEQLEIADCQGSDSSNPLHLAMIQDYLNQTHLIIYVISSRTGVRRADIRFLSMIKKMGIMDNILFVINFDFNEHGSLDDLSALVNKTVGELALIKPNPKVFALSALFNLFMKIETTLPEKDKYRLSQWQSEKEMREYSDRNSNDFISTFRSIITEERQSVLWRNHLERLERIVSGMKHWLNINGKMISQDEQSASQIADRIQQYQARMNQIRAMMNNTLDGALNQIKKEIKSRADQFFGGKSDGVIAAVIHYIKSYDVGVNRYVDDLSTRGFNAAMYQIFQDFRQAIDTFMAESITPQILGYVREMEKYIEKELFSVSNPYDVMIQDAMAEFSRSMAELDISPPGSNMTSIVLLPDAGTTKRVAGISFPSAMVTLHYSAKIKTEAIFRLGFYTVLTFVKQVLKKPLRSEKEKELSALSDGVRRMRSETEKTISYHFIDYKENLKFQYLIKLADAMSRSVKETLLNRFQSYMDSLLQMRSLVSNKQLDEVHAASILAEMSVRTEEIEAGLFTMREQLGPAVTAVGKGGVA
ncbi:MAG: dynamin family protein [Desulfobacterales bacterium]|jgi:GTPase SAR1 family protein|nr:dynamin family protein [Desulfobacterales bacterium]